MAHHAPAIEPDRDEVAFRGYLAEFAGPEALVHGAEAARTAGRTQLDAHVPFPVHGLDDALGIRPTRLPWLVFIMGVTGGVSILLFQLWVNGIDYPWIISGKPLFSIPANIPVTFEVTVLFSAFTAFLAMLAINRLPRLHQPLMETAIFDGVTSDKFVLFIPATVSESAPAADLESRLRNWGATNTEPLYAPVRGAGLPRNLKLLLICLASLLAIPPFFVWGMRGVPSEEPRLHVIFDMDDQPKYKAQQTSVFFADARAMRPQVPGTVEWSEDVGAIDYERGLDPARVDDTMISLLLQPDEGDAAPAVGDNAAPAEGTAPGAEGAAPGAEGNAPPAGGGNPAGDAAAEPELPWLEDFPSSLVIDERLMARGRARYNIYCAVCHGLGGDGNGLVSQRAIELQQATWVPPTSLHTEEVVKQPVGQIYNTIVNGVRKMPAYGDQILPQDRWAIVLYVRALQRSRKASLEDVPANLRGDLEELAPAPAPTPPGDPPATPANGATPQGAGSRGAGTPQGTGTPEEGAPAETITPTDPDAPVTEAPSGNEAAPDDAAPTEGDAPPAEGDAPAIEETP
ncbi:MAG TPA: quinol:electron acceptor oxidoreductase subunit ActD [Pirellulaceae bacterium]|jgi:mono/diheme cytochrome c family protein|nr:quinol:electron acceptor oxidoreductase subunit ActD [Pirellulaceae bacterium]